MKKSALQSVLQYAGSVIAAALIGGCVSSGEFEKLQTEKNQEIDSLQKQRAALEQQTRELQSQRRALEEQRTALERQQNDLRAELATLARQKAQLEAANMQTKSQYDGLVR
jgi:septal ring factor EnvC (AmiA/AmiB activator)